MFYRLCQSLSSFQGLIIERLDPESTGPKEFSQVVPVLSSYATSTPASGPSAVISGARVGHYLPPSGTARSLLTDQGSLASHHSMPAEPRTPCQVFSSPDRFTVTCDKPNTRQYTTAVNKSRIHPLSGGISP